MSLKWFIASEGGKKDRVIMASLLSKIKIGNFVYARVQTLHLSFKKRIFLPTPPHQFVANLFVVQV